MQNYKAYLNLHLVPKARKLERGRTSQAKYGGKDCFLLPPAPLPLVINREPFVWHALDVDRAPERRKRRRVRSLGCTRTNTNYLL